VHPLFRRFRGPIIVPAPIVTEVAYFLPIEPGPAVEAAFLDALARGELIVEATTAQDFARMADLVRQYADFPRVALPMRSSAGSRRSARSARWRWSWTVMPSDGTSWARLSRRMKDGNSSYASQTGSASSDGAPRNGGQCIASATRGVTRAAECCRMPGPGPFLRSAAAG